MNSQARRIWTTALLLATATVVHAQTAIKKPTAEEVQAATKWVAELGEQARQASPKIRRLETSQFSLFTTLDQPSDKLYMATAKAAYDELARMFAIKPLDVVWVGKCPIFVFNDAEQYDAFCKAVGQPGDDAKDRIYIVLNNTKESPFAEGLVREIMRAFLARYQTTQELPVWVSEGLAEHLCNTLIPNRQPSGEGAAETSKAGLRPIVIRKAGLEQNLNRTYHTARVLVQQMIREDEKAFLKFVQQLKQGESEEKALQATFNTTHDELIRKTVNELVWAIDPPTEEELQAARTLTEALAAKGKQTAANLNKIETPHFYLYSTFTSKGDDEFFKRTATNMYELLCKQFAIKPEPVVWVDKLPIFAFSTKAQYISFCNVIGKGDLGARTAGFMSTSGVAGHAYIAVCSSFQRQSATGQLTDAYDPSWFGELMVHEGTHAFMTRYLTSRRLPTWLNEGIAEYMSGTLIKNSEADRRRVRALQAFVAGSYNPMSVFDEVKTGGHDYGMAYALTSYLIQKDASAFRNFVQLIKRGTPEEEALKLAYKTDHASLVNSMRAAIKR
ncbi:MAG: hypothetical protein FWD53_03480 [Phycisphaerales bacterium]|nr:hypothetical protein [Phycisphaerales bacterium]